MTAELAARAATRENIACRIMLVDFDPIVIFSA